MNIIDWSFELKRSNYDDVVGIRIVKLACHAEFGTYLTTIEPGKAVGAHYHKIGAEHYHIIRGQGEMTLTDMVSRRATATIVGAQSSFSVPENTLHQLRNIGDEPLVLMFSCPESHLDEDRFLS